MNIEIEDIEVAEGITIVGSLPQELASKLLIEGLGNNEAVCVYPSVINDEYNTTIKAGSYKAQLFYGTKKATFTLDRSIDLTPIFEQMSA